MKQLSLTIGWLYPDLMSTYGDHGNILSLQKRAEWRNIAVTLLPLSIGSSHKELLGCDLLFMGGAQDRQQSIVSNDINQGKAGALHELVETNTPGLYICGAYQFLGKYYKEADGSIIDGLGILDLHTENPGIHVPRLVGNIVFTAPFLPQMTLLVGFENHGGRTYLGEQVRALGKVVKGFGNNGKDQTEGAMYKNSFGSYAHGPLLPKNPAFADYLIKKALEKKYAESIDLTPLDDKLEQTAHETIVRRLKLDV